MAKENYVKKICLKDDMIDLLAEKRTKIARQNGKNVDYVRDRRLEREREQQQQEEEEREREPKQERERGIERDRQRRQEGQQDRQPQQEQQPDQQQPGSSGTQNGASEMLVVLESILFITLIEQAFPTTTNLTFN